MPRDARLGFVVGVALVILIAVIFYHGGKAGLAGNVDASPSAAKANNLPVRNNPESKSPLRSHVLREGETLSNLAVRYYGDASKAEVLFRANRSQLDSRERVPAGTVLLIPDVSDR